MALNPAGNEIDVTVRGKDKVSGVLDNIVAKFGSLKMAVGLAGGALAGLAIGGLAKAASAAAGLDAAMTESVAIMGEVSDVMRNDMSAAAREVAKTTTFSAEEAAESYFFLASAGLDAKQSIEALPQVAQFAQAGMFDMATATDLLTDAQSALGLASDDAAENQRQMARVSDVLVKANTLANASVEQFSEALTNKAAPAMKTLNVPLEEGTAALAVFADQGLKGRRAGTIFARTLQGLETQARDNAGAFEEMNVEVFDAEGNMRPLAAITEDLEGALGDMSVEQRSAALAQLGFNERTSQGIQLLMGNSEQLRNYEDELGNAGGTTEDVAEKQLKSFNAQLDLLKSQLHDVFITIGQAILPVLTNLLKKVKPVVEGFAEWVEGLSDAEVRMGAVLSVLVPLGVAIAALSAPLAVVAGAVALLGAAVATNFGGIRDAVMDVVGVLGGELKQTAISVFSVAENVINTFAEVWSRQGGNVEGSVRSIVSVLRGDLMAGIREVFGWVRLQLVKFGIWWHHHGEEVAETVVGFLTTVAGAVKWYIGLVRENIRMVLDAVTRLWDEHGEQIMAIVDQFVTVVVKAVELGMLLFREAILPVLRRVMAFWLAHRDDVVRIVRKLVNLVMLIVLPFVEWLYGIISTYLDLVMAGWEEWGDEIMWVVDHMVTIILGIIGWFLDYLETAIDVVTAAIQGDWETVWSEIAGFLKRTVRGIVRWLKTAGKDIIASAIDVIIKVIKHPFEQLYNWLIGDSFFPDMFRDIVAWLRTTAKNAIKGAFNFITDAIESVLGGIDLSGVESMINGVIGLANKAIDAINAIPAVPDIPNVPEVNLPGGGATSTASQRSTRRRSGGHRLAVMQGGGIVPGHVDELLATLHGPEAVIPLDRMDDFGGTQIGPIHIHANTEAGGRAAARGLDAELRSRGFTR